MHNTGLALGAALLQQPWTVTGVMLAGTLGYYQEQVEALLAAFSDQQKAALSPSAALPLEWAERLQPRRFGNVLPGEIAECQRIARTHGILLDPIYSLAAWEVATAESAHGGPVAMLHAGGALALHGLAQRFPEDI